MYGLLGKKLGHSFSKTIHEDLTNREYNLIEIDELRPFFAERGFKGLNVTIPYKNDVIPYLDKLSPESSATNAVNTIIFKGGELWGYNTDYYGLDKALSYNDISVTNKNIIILGNGSTSRTIKYYCEQNFAKNITILARNPKGNEYNFTYVDNLKNTDIVFNATPVGMFPNNISDTLVDLNSLPNLISLVDVVYNPLRSNHLIEAEKRGIKTVNGLLMLMYQAIKSIELFHNIHISDQETLKYYRRLLVNQTNIVFIGMPMSGKSHFSRVCAKLFDKRLIEVDYRIEKEAGLSIPEIFEIHGESHFRNLEAQTILKYSKRHNQAISCGGGVVLQPDNMNLLRQNGIIIFLDASLELLKNCNPKNRPLLKDKRNIEILYNQRYDLYRHYADIIVTKDNFDTNAILSEIEVNLNEYIDSKWS